MADAHLAPASSGDDNSDEDVALPDTMLDFAQHERNADIVAAMAAVRVADSDAGSAHTDAVQAPAELPAHRIRVMDMSADLQAEDEAAAALSLAENGFVIVEPAAPSCAALIGPALRLRCEEAAVAQCEWLLAEVGRRMKINVFERRFYTAEICHRVDNGLRYDMRVDGPGGEACWTDLREAVARLARPIIHRSGLFAGRCAAQGEIRVDMAGCVTSFPSACHQHFHPDGPSPGLVNCFVPLVDVDHRNGSTELKPGTHRDDRSARFQNVIAREVGIAADMPAGSLLLFDFRTHHRGREHRRSDRPRPMAYVILAAPGVSDTHNFGGYRSVWDYSDDKYDDSES